MDPTEESVEVLRAIKEAYEVIADAVEEVCSQIKWKVSIEKTLPNEAFFLEVDIENHKHKIVCPAELPEEKKLHGSIELLRELCRAYLFENRSPLFAVFPSYFRDVLTEEQIETIETIYLICSDFFADFLVYVSTGRVKIAESILLAENLLNCLIEDGGRDDLLLVQTASILAFLEKCGTKVGFSAPINSDLQARLDAVKSVFMNIPMTALQKSSVEVFKETINRLLYILQTGIILHYYREDGLELWYPVFASKD